jgi:hypothetical protein
MKSKIVIYSAALTFAMATGLLEYMPDESNTAIYRTMVALICVLYFIAVCLVNLWYDMKPIQLYRLSYRTGSDPFEGAEHSRYYQWLQEAEFHKKILIDQSSALPAHARSKGLSYHTDSQGKPVYTISIEGPLLIDEDIPRLYELKDIWPDTEVADKYYPTPANVVRELFSIDSNLEDLIQPADGPKVIGKINLDEVTREESPTTNGSVKEIGQYNIFHKIADKRYRLAGYVEADSLEQAFYKSQHAVDSTVKWSFHERSTMVGDIIEAPSEICYEVLGTGFKELPQ